MKRFSLFLLTFITLAAGALAQRGPGAGPGGDRGPERFLMTLPAETREAVIRLRAEHEIERTALVVKFREGALTYPQFIEQRDGMRDRHQAAIRTKLTPDQRAAFDAHIQLMQERRANGPGRGGRGRGGW